jgi:hypothetical protein
MLTFAAADDFRSGREISSAGLIVLNVSAIIWLFAFLTAEVVLLEQRIAVVGE